MASEMGQISIVGTVSGPIFANFRNETKLTVIF